MSSYVVTGANRGLGLAFIRALSKNPDNIVVGLVRNKKVADERMVKEKISNVTIIQADVTDLPALKDAAVEVAKLTGGKLDCLINNAAYVSDAAEKTVEDFLNDSEGLEKDINISISVNVNGMIKTTNTFLPLIMASDGAKKVVTLSTGLADIPMQLQMSLPVSAPYSISKAALNMAIAKYQAVYAEKGILFLGVSPGVVNTYETPREIPKGGEGMMKKFMEYAPEWRGPISPDESAGLCLKVIDQKSLEGGDGGKMFSHWGNDRWL